MVDGRAQPPGDHGSQLPSGPREVRRVPVPQRRCGDPDILEALDRAILRRYQMELATVLPHPRTRARALVALRVFPRFSCDEGWTDKDLSRQVTIPRFVMTYVRPVQTDDVPRLLAALPMGTFATFVTAPWCISY